MRPAVAVVDHGMGNLRSVAKALDETGATASISDEPAAFESADALCVPGQGIFGRCMANLSARGMGDVILEWVAGSRPLLGICLGMQVLFDDSEEGGAPGLGVLRGSVRRLPGTVRVPHIGWNTVSDAGGKAEHYYFDHSFAVYPEDEGIVRGWCEHGNRFAAWVGIGSVTAVQFHPEKSSRAGIGLLEGWVRSI